MPVYLPVSPNVRGLVYIHTAGRKGEGHAGIVLTLRILVLHKLNLFFLSFVL